MSPLGDDTDGKEDISLRNGVHTAICVVGNDTY